MDPNQALADLRAVMARLREWEEREDWPKSPALLSQHDADLREATELFEGLDEWLRKDGWVPADWESPDSQMGSRR